LFYHGWDNNPQIQSLPIEFNGIGDYTTDEDLLEHNHLIDSDEDDIEEDN
jgi:hypothetical protein